jgi:hypothetical protein
VTIFHRLTGLATRAEIPVLIAIAPALLFPSPQRLWVLVMPPLLWACAYAATGQALPPTRFNRPLLMILAMVPVSLIVSTDIHSSLGKVCGLTLGILLFWAIARWLKTPARLKLAVTAYVAAGAILSVIGLLGTKWIFKYRALGIMASHLPPVIPAAWYFLFPCKSLSWQAGPTAGSYHPRPTHFAWLSSSSRCCC